MLSYFPKTFSKKVIWLYLAALLLVSVIFMKHSMKLLFVIAGVISVITFFHFSNILPKKWASIPEKAFGKKLFSTALIIRVVWVLVSCLMFWIINDDLFDFEGWDAKTYHICALYGHELMSKGEYFENILNLGVGSDIADTGYLTYLSFIYLLTNDSIIIVRLLKAIWSAWTCLLIYKIAFRNFGSETGRLAGIMCMLAPNLIYYCGLHLKEVEMVFIATLFIERADCLMRTNRLSVAETSSLVLIAVLLFFFRTALAAVACLSLFMALVFSSQKLVSTGKKIFMGILVSLVLGVAVGDTIQTEVQTMIDSRDQQEGNMKWRSEREGGNKFAVYAGKTVFAPLIFTIPFPTMVTIEQQEQQQMLNGGNFVKNVTSFFTILAMFLFLRTGDWRKHVMPISYMLGYLVVLVVSQYAQSERFHQPILPFSLMFAAYAICNIKKKHERFFNFWMIFIFAVVIGWNWFKLAGRGMA